MQATRRDFMRALGALGLGGVSEACGGAKAPPAEHGWQNAVKSAGIDPAMISTPTSAREIVDAVRNAEAKRQRIRMTGSGHSFSDVAMTRGHLMSPKGLTRCVRLDRARLKDEFKDDRHLGRALGGTTIRQENRRLEAVGLAFQNLGGYDAQTIVGAASTGTHGSGLGFGPITSQIVAWQVVTAGGKLLQIEPSNGVSDPARFPGTLEEDPTIPVVLRQSDELYDAIEIGLGCLGIVYAVVLRAVDLYWLKERRTLGSMEKLSKSDGFLGRLVADAGASLPSELQHYEIYFDPYPDPNSGEHTALLTERFHVSSKPATLSTARGTPDSAWDAAIAVTASKSGILPSLMDALDARGAESLISRSLSHMAEADYTEVCHRVFNLGELNVTRVYGIELGFPLERSLDVVRRVYEIAARLGKDRVCHPAPISLRFVAASNAFLAPQQGTKTCMMELGVPVGARGAEPLLKSYEHELSRDFAARPHWGLDLGELQGQAAAKRLWPATWDRWLAVHRELNASGVFDGEISDRLGISTRR